MKPITKSKVISEIIILLMVNLYHSSKIKITRGVRDIITNPSLFNCGKSLRNGKTFFDVPARSCVCTGNILSRDDEGLQCFQSTLALLQSSITLFIVLL